MPRDEAVLPLDDSHLRPPGSQAHLMEYVRRLYDMRAFAWVTARRGIESTNSTTVLGRLWLLLGPAIMIAIYWVMFGVVLDISRGTQNFAAFLTVGHTVFRHSQAGIISASASLVTNTAVLRSLSFPRAVLPLTQSLNAMAHAAFSYAVLLLVLPLMGVPPRLGWLTLAPLLCLQAVMNYGIGMLLARPVTRFADLRVSMTYFFRILFYGSGVLFPVDEFLEGRRYGSVVLDLFPLNPFYSFIGLARWAALGTEPDRAGYMACSVVLWTVLSLACGLVVFVRGERDFGGVRTVVLQ